MENEIKKIQHLVERYDERLEWQDDYEYCTVCAETGEETWHSVEQWFDVSGYVVRSREAWEECLAALGVEKDSQWWREAESTLSRWREHVGEEEIYPVRVHVAYANEHGGDAHDTVEGTGWYDITR